MLVWRAVRTVLPNPRDLSPLQLDRPGTRPGQARSRRSRPRDYLCRCRTRDSFRGGSRPCATGVTVRGVLYHCRPTARQVPHKQVEGSIRLGGKGHAQGILHAPEALVKLVCAAGLFAVVYSQPRGQCNFRVLSTRSHNAETTTRRYNRSKSCPLRVSELGERFSYC